MEKDKLRIWLVPFNKNIKSISLEEEQFSEKLTPIRCFQYQFSRGYARLVLSHIFNIKPLEVPLFSPPGKPPILADNYGFLSISHCSNALLLAWSNKPVGADIERFDRSFSPEKLSKKFYSEKDKTILSNYNGESLRDKALDFWIVKEAAIKLMKSNFVKELNQWEWDENKCIASHRENDYMVKVMKLDFYDWKIAIAFDKKITKKFCPICFYE